MNQQTKADALIKGRQSTEILHLLISNEYALLSLFFLYPVYFEFSLLYWANILYVCI